MGLFDKFRKNEAVVPEKPMNPPEVEIKPEDVAAAIASALAEKFNDQISRNELAPHVGRLAIAIGQKGYSIVLESYIDALDGTAPILTRAGELLLGDHGIAADFAQVVDERNVPIKNVVSTHVQVTPNPLVPPDDRAVFYPPDSGKPAPLNMLSPRPKNTLAGGLVGVDSNPLNIALGIGPLSQ